MQVTTSVILPFYNAENTLKRATDSILNQSYSDFELLLINNNSTDNSLSIAKIIAENDLRVRLINETKQGVANAMNNGLLQAKGQFVARMDADDVAHPNRLEKQISFLKDNPEVGLVGCYVEYVPHNKNTAGFKRFVDWVNSFHTSEEIEIQRFVEIPVVNPTIFFRKELFETYRGCIDGELPEDYEMQLRYLDKGIKMAKLPEKLLEWHDYSSRLTRIDKRYSSDAFFKTKAIYFTTWSEKHNRFHPKIWIWGAGRKTRQRSIFLQEQGLKIDSRIDIVKSKNDSVYYKDIPGPGNTFIVSMVTNTGAGQQIREFLLAKNYIEGIDFILMG